MKERIIESIEYVISNNYIRNKIKDTAKCNYTFGYTDILAKIIEDDNNLSVYSNDYNDIIVCSQEVHDKTKIIKAVNNGILELIAYLKERIEAKDKDTMEYKYNGKWRILKEGQYTIWLKWINV